MVRLLDDCIRIEATVVDDGLSICRSSCTSRDDFTLMTLGRSNPEELDAGDSAGAARRLRGSRKHDLQVSQGMPSVDFPAAFDRRRRNGQTRDSSSR